MVDLEEDAQKVVDYFNNIRREHSERPLWYVSVQEADRLCLAVAHLGLDNLLLSVDWAAVYGVPGLKNIITAAWTTAARDSSPGVELDEDEVQLEATTLERDAHQQVVDGDPVGLASERHQAVIDELQRKIDWLAVIC